MSNVKAPTLVRVLKPFPYDETAYKRDDIIGMSPQDAELFQKLGFVKIDKITIEQRPIRGGAHLKVTY